MNICVYGAASKTLDRKYIDAVENLGEHLAKRGHNLVFGGGRSGLMGAAARGFTRGGAKEIICVAPKFFNVDGVLYEYSTEYIHPDTMRERKAILEKKSDAFIAAPGGIGTFDELFEIVTLRSLSQHEKPVVLYNACGFYNPMLEMLEAYEKEGFLKSFTELVYVSDSASEIAEYLENYRGEKFCITQFKNI
ncbi:MAG: TIGR00730 family Rossman fold protein [Clostridia bacterium]|nr:TIGR00730 family Rossman fold protein [Clostridia bacterium]